MKRRDQIYIAVLALLVVAYAVAEYTAPKQLDWSSSFKPSDSIPYGTLIMTDLLDEAFPGAKVVTTDEPLYSVLIDEDRYPRPFNLIIVNRTLAREARGADFAIDPFDTELLLSFVHSGGTAFLAAESFSGALADSLNIDTFPWYGFGFDTDRPEEIASAIEDGLDSIDVHIEDRSRVEFSNPLLDSLSFDVERRVADWYFDSVDTLRTTVLASLQYRDSREAAFVRVRYGEGAFYLSTLPYSFTNYALLDSAASGLSFAALSHLPVQTTVWNANYIPGRGQTSSTPLRYVLSHAGLRWAWFLVLGGGVLFILFRARRKQRVIPVVHPHKNVTLEFVDTVGRLYFQRGNHSDLAEKKIVHFHEYLRSRLGIDGRSLDAETLSRISSRSGVPVEIVTRIVAAINEVSGRKKITSGELLQLSKPIDEFYRLARR